jgi:hypothetical protein
VVFEELGSEQRLYAVLHIVCEGQILIFGQDGCIPLPTMICRAEGDEHPQGPVELYQVRIAGNVDDLLNLCLISSLFSR